MRATLLVLLVLVGCEFAPPTRERSSLEPHSTGGTMYVIETWDDFLDEVDTVAPFGPTAGVRWLGEQSLRLVLRAVSSGKQSRLLSVRHFDLNQWEEVELPPDRPVHFLEREEDGRYGLRELGSRAGFALEVRPAKLEEAKYVDLEYAVNFFWPDHPKLPGTALEAGRPSIKKVPVGSGTHKIPIGGALWIPYPREGDRAFLVLLHIASVTPASAR